MVPPEGPMFMTWCLGPTFVSHVVDTGATVPPAGPTLVTWRHGSVGGSHNHEVGHGPTNRSHEHDVAPWWHLLVPTSLTWRHGPTKWVLTSGSHHHDVAPWSHLGPIGGSTPHLTWSCGAKSAARSSLSDFYFIWQKKLAPWELGSHDLLLQSQKNYSFVLYSCMLLYLFSY